MQVQQTLTMSQRILPILQKGIATILSASKKKTFVSLVKQNERIRTLTTISSHYRIKGKSINLEFVLQHSVQQGGNKQYILVQVSEHKFLTNNLIK